eukprot:m.18439 g.18439  ORF g.18439 m.18439 type:complete len:92 (-) comp4960_c1_seq1:232-507(-)
MNGTVFQLFVRAYLMDHDVVVPSLPPSFFNDCNILLFYFMNAFYLIFVITLIFDRRGVLLPPNILVSLFSSFHVVVNALTCIHDSDVTQIM